MTLNYKGQSKFIKNFNERVAVISFSLEEEDLLEQIMGMMEKVTYWRYTGIGHCYYVPVDDFEEYQDFQDWFHEARKIYRDDLIPLQM